MPVVTYHDYSSYIDSPRRSLAAEESMYPQPSDRKQRACSAPHIPLSPLESSANELPNADPDAAAGDASQRSRYSV
jgi:hypothetical protein